MKISLRKANAIQLLINESINTATADTILKVGKHDKVSEVLPAAEKNLFNGLIQKEDLTNVLYRIRCSVSAAGQTAGVSDKLAEIARIDKVIGIYKPLATASAFVPSSEVLELQQIDLKEEGKNAASYSRRDSFDTTIIRKEWKDKYIALSSELRKQKQNLSDELLELNIKTEIEVSPFDADVLKRYGII